MLFILIPIYFILCWYLARLMTNAYNESVVYQNYFPNESVQDWNLITEDNQKVSAWFLKKDTSKVVILLAGKGGNRLSMIDKARYYLDKIGRAHV